MRAILAFTGASARTEVRLGTASRQSGTPGKPSAAGVDLNGTTGTERDNGDGTG